VKASFTAAIVVRSLWAALGEVCVAGLLVGWVAVRLVVCWPVSWDVVVAVDIDTWNLLGENVEGPTAKTGGGTAWKTPWLVTVFGRWKARSAMEATMEPSATIGRNQGAKIPDERCLTGRRASIRMGTGLRGVPHT
jgi:hypothetical protein